MHAGNLRDKLMYDTTWINNHVGNCVSSLLSRNAFLNVIHPLIIKAKENEYSEEKMEIEFAEIAELSLRQNDELTMVVDCINRKVVHEAQTVGLPAFESLYLALSCALFARFFSCTLSEIGYISL